MTFSELAAALASSAREEILALLGTRPTCTLNELGEATGLSSPTVCQHLDILEKTGLIRRIRSGRHVLVQATCSVEIVIHDRDPGVWESQPVCEVNDEV